MDRTRGRFTPHGELRLLRSACRRALAGVGWPAMLLAAGIALVAAVALIHERSSLAALERPAARHHAAASTQVQRAPAMPLILKFDLRP